MKLNCAVKYLNILVLVGVVVLWPIATWLKWVNSAAFISHISMAAFLYAAILAVQASCLQTSQDDLAEKVSEIAEKA